MPDRSEEMNHALAVKAKYEDDLLARPGVKSVGVGLRQKSGEYTEEVCIVVTVHTKHPLGDLEASEVLPTNLEGIPVDVQEVGDINV
jgi:hypothetical protein